MQPDAKKGAVTEYRNRRSHVAIVADTSALITGMVCVESPFRLWPATLNEFTGGAFSYVSPGCNLHRVTIGRYCSIGHALEVLSNHPVHGLTTSPFPYQKIFPAPFDQEPGVAFQNLGNTSIGNDVWIGAGVKIKSGVSIGDGAIVGAGSVVVKNVAPFEIVGGIPAKRIRMRFSDAVIDRILRIRWWQYDLLGLGAPMENPEGALDFIEDRISGSEPLLPYPPNFFRLWSEDGLIKAKRNAAGF